jgi:hypothetical protein
MKDRRMRITRIRNDKELGLVKREVDLLKEESGGLEHASRLGQRAPDPLCGHGRELTVVDHRAYT